MKLLIQTLFFSTIFVIFLLISPTLKADGNAGVGVMNVPPTFSDIRIMQQDNSVRIYLTLSDYNSWMDIYKVKILLEHNDNIVASFLFQQYEDEDSYEPINRFTDELNLNLLQIKSCDAHHADESVTISERCHLNLRFVFNASYFSQLHVITEDRVGDTAETFVEYYAGGDIQRDSNTLFIPWINKNIKLVLPPHLLDISILLVAIISTVYIGKKSQFSETLQKVFYGTK